jgi:hypothetical protein
LILVVFEYNGRGLDARRPGASGVSSPQQANDAERRAAKEINRLWGDSHLAAQTLAEHLGKTTIDAPTRDHGNYFAVTGDLWHKLLRHSLAVALLLERGGFESATVVHRAAYEVGINLVYLITQGDKVRNAVLFRARSLVEIAALYADQSAGADARRIIDTIPPAIMAEVMTAVPTAPMAPMRDVR